MTNKTLDKIITKTAISTFAIAKIADFLFMPTSFYRTVHKGRKNGHFQPEEKYKDSKFAKALPYIGATILETGRLIIYYDIFN